jgi:hypothetical protein
MHAFARVVFLFVLATIYSVVFDLKRCSKQFVCTKISNF